MNVVLFHSTNVALLSFALRVTYVQQIRNAGEDGDEEKKNQPSEFILNDQFVSRAILCRKFL